MAARILQAADAAAALILASWSDKGKHDCVERIYAPPVSLTEDSQPVLRGRKVFVFPGPYAASLLDRADQWRTYTLRTLTVERYTDDSGPPPREWIDARTEFVEQNVFNVLANQSVELIDQMTPAMDERPTIDVLYDIDTLLKFKTFWSQATFYFAEDTDLAGEVLL